MVFTLVSYNAVKAKKVLGKLFYLELDGEGKMPVLHFGMTGAIQACV